MTSDDSRTADEPARPDLADYANEIASAEMIIRNNGW